MTVKVETKVEALAKFLGIEPEEKGDIDWAKYDLIEEPEDVFHYGNQEYLVLTDQEADEKAGEYIEESLWAFNTGFIIDHMEQGEGFDYRATEESIKLIQEKQCESANPVIKALIADIGEFIEDAIGADGRGHFLAGYDGEENEEGDFYIYRIN